MSAPPVYKLEKDLCRCCHAEGSFFNLSDTVYNSGQVEVYSDMLQTTLDLEIMPMDGDVNMMTFTICGQCVLRLRDAHNFKQQVIECEQRFKLMYSNMVLADRKTVNIVQIKEEVDAEVAEKFEEDIKNGVNENSGDDFHWKSDHSEEEPEVKIKFVSKSKPKPRSKQKQSPTKPASSEPVAETSKTSENPEDPENPETPWWHRDAKPPKGPRSNSSFKSYSPPPHQDDSVGNKKRLPRQAIQFMKTWLADHVEHPYPSEEEKEAMASQLNLTLLQVSNWFINARRRILPLLEDDDQSANEHDQTPVEGTDYRFEGENCVCCHCGKVYLRFGSSEMMNHIKWEHFMIPRYTCQECGLGFTKEGPMIAHKLQEHEIDERKKCPECESLFNTKPLLEYHMRTIHQMSKKMQCEFCHFESYSKQAMRDHNLNHKDERNFPCKRCGKAFKIRKQLKQHEYIHSRERKIVCKECGKSFAQRGSITYHMAKYHPGVKF